MAVADSLYAEFKEPLYAPPPLLSRMVEAGLLGRKSGPWLLHPRHAESLSGGCRPLGRAVPRR